VTLSPEAANAALTALMYAYLLEAGADAKIPDFSSSFGYQLTPEDKAALDPLYDRAKRHAAASEIGRWVKVPETSLKRALELAEQVPLASVRIFGRDHLPS
jgi:hypothetical protein